MISIFEIYLAVKFVSFRSKYSNARNAFGLSLFMVVVLMLLSISSTLILNSYDENNEDDASAGAIVNSAAVCLESTFEISKLKILGTKVYLISVLYSHVSFSSFELTKTH